MDVGWRAFTNACASAMGQINRIVRLGREINDREFLEDISRAVILYSESFALRIGVHEALFRNVVQMLGNKQQQEEWIENVNEFKIIGCFAMVRTLLDRSPLLYTDSLNRLSWVIALP